MAFTAAALLVACAPIAAAAEDDEEEFDIGVWLNTNDEAAGLIRRARRAQINNNWRMAIDKYLLAASKFDDTVFAESPRFYLPTSVLIRRELEAMPLEGRELYKVLKSGEADMAYGQALAAGNQKAMERVPTEYPCLPAAPRALYVLGEWAWARGDAGRALYYWQRLLTEYPQWEDASRVALLTRAALCAASSGRGSEAGSLLARLEELSALARLRVGGHEVQAAKEIRLRIEKHRDPEVGSVESREGFWPTIGGSAAHDKPVRRLVDAGVCRWQIDFKSAQANLPRGGYDQFGRRIVGSTSAAPHRYPVCAGGMVFIAGNSDIVALRTMSGRKAWRASKDWRQPDDKLNCSRMTMPAVGGDKVFVVMGQPSPRNYNRNFMGRQRQGGSTNLSLRAYALTGGKLRWESNTDEKKKTAEFLKSVDLSATPVYADGYVYCPAVKHGSIDDAYMLCFDASDGRLVWSTLICASQPLRLRSGPAEGGLPAAVADGRVTFVTNLGVLATMDAASGQLLWMYLYDRSEAAVNNPRTGRNSSQPEAWAPSAPIVKNGIIYATPQDCPNLLAVDLATGRIKWKAQRGPLRRLVGLSGDKLLLSGSKQIAAVSAASGKRLWSGVLGDGDVGLGLVGSDFAIIPTEGAIHRFDLTTGKLKATYRFKDGAGEPGNLIISGDVLVSVGTGAAGGYYSWEEITTKLAGQIEADPDTAFPRFEMGEVHFAADKYRESSRFFKEALARIKPGEKPGGVLLEPLTRARIWECHSELGGRAENGEKFAEALAEYREGQKYTSDDNQKMVGHMRFARCLENLEEWTSAIAEYQLTLTTYRNETYFVETTGAGRSKHPGKVAADHFSKAQIDRIIASRDREVYARFDTEAREKLAAAAAAGDEKAAAKIVKDYPNSDSVSPALILLSELALDAGQASAAAAHLREHLWKRPDSPRKVEVYARLALAYHAQDMSRLSGNMMNRMLQKWPEESFRLGDEAWTVKAFVAARMPDIPAGGQGASRPDLAPPLETAWKVSLRGGAQLLPNASRQDLTGMACVLFTGSELTAIDLRNGKRAWRRTDLKTANPQARAVGMIGMPPQARFTGLASPGAILLYSGGKLLALSPASGKTVWESTLQGEAPQRGRQIANNALRLASGEGVVAAFFMTTSIDPRTNQQRRKSKLTVLDESTGLPVWEAGQEGFTPLDALIAEGALVVAALEQKTRRVKITGYELGDGSVRFSAAAPATSGVATQLVERSGLLLFVSGNHQSCYDMVTGKLQWKESNNAQSNRILAADASRVVIASARNARNKISVEVTARAMKGGKRLWSAPSMSGSLIYGETTDDTENVVLAVNDARQRRRTRVIAYDGQSGKLRWSSDLPEGSYVSSPLVGLKHVAAITRVRKGRDWLQERRVWDLQNGKLVEARKAAAGSTQLRAHEGAALSVNGGTVERLAPAAKGEGSRQE